MNLSRHTLEMREYRKNHPEYVEKNKEWTRKYYQRMRVQILEHYSGGKPKCALCGIEEQRVLCIDHVNNNGKEERAIIKRTIGKTGFLIRIIKDGFPSGYQVLCMNCNHLRGIEYVASKRSRV